jgi:membrane protein required for colicin V production
VESWPIGPGDIAVLVVLLISAVLAFLRGFLREFLGLVAWVGAALVAFYSYEPLQPYLRELIGIDWLADIVTALGVFIVALVIFSILAHYASRGIRASALSAVDRSLGFLFGLVRGAVLVALAYLLMIYINADDRLPGWVENARSQPLVHRVAQLLVDLVPEGAFGSDDRLLLLREQIETPPPDLESLSQPQPGGGADGEDPPVGYTEDQQNDMQRLLDTTNN